MIISSQDSQDHKLCDIYIIYNITSWVAMTRMDAVEHLSTWIRLFESICFRALESVIFKTFIQHL